MKGQASANGSGREKHRIELAVLFLHSRSNFFEESALMSELQKGLDGNSWEADVKRWLRLKYPNDFQEIPAVDKGDAGIEGFCICDCLVYQCYAPLAQLDTKALYEHQRDKMTEDVGKFIQNKVKLTAVLPRQFRARRYCFVVPEYRSRDLVVHANTQSERVRNARLGYAADDFAILVHKKEDYEPQQREEQLRLLRKLKLDLEDVKKTAVSEWVVGNNLGVQNLDRKIKTIYALKDPKDIEVQREYWIERKICTDNALEKLRSRTPEAWENLWEVKRARENLLGRQYSSVGAKPETVAEISEKLASDMISRVPNIERVGAETLAEGLVGGWLQDCKLNFPTISDGVAPK